MKEEVIVAAEHVEMADPRVITERNFLVLFGYKKNRLCLLALIDIAAEIAYFIVVAFKHCAQFAEDGAALQKPGKGK